MTTQTKNNPVEKLLLCFKWRNRLYNKGCNDEKLNDKIRRLQAETDYKIIDSLGKEAKKVIMAILLLLSTSIYSQVYVSAGIDVRNAVIGSDPTNNKPAFDGIFQFGMIGGNTEVSIGYERFNKICFDKMFFSIGHQFPLYAYVSGKEIKTLLITSVEPTLIGRWGEVWQTKSSHLSVGVSIGLRYQLNDKFDIELNVNALPRTDLSTRYPEVNKEIPVIISNYFKVIYRL